MIAYLYKELEFFLKHNNNDLAEYLLRLIPSLLDVSQEVVPYCQYHGIVPHSHRCNYFDDMPNQVTRQEIRG